MLPNWDRTDKLAQYSELGQERFVLGMTNLMTAGFFVEIGLMDGCQYSNTYLLEKEFGWQGIVVEPNARYHADIAVHRTCRIDHRAVTGRSGDRLLFKDITAQPGLSGLLDHFQTDTHSATRAQDSGCVSLVETVSLHDLLRQHDAPAHIDYVSIDVEGAEMEILRHFDWRSWSIDLMTVEHNFVPVLMNGVRDIMQQQGYHRIEWPDLDVYEDWFYQPHLLERIQQ